MKGETPTPTLGERMARAMGWNLLFFPLKMGVRFAAGLVVVWALAKADYGRVQVLLGSTMATLWTYTGLGLGRSAVRFLPEIEVRQGRAGVWRFLRTLLTVRIALLLAAVAVLNLYAPTFARLFHLGEDGAFYLRIVGFFLLMRAVTDLAYRVLQAYLQQGRSNFVELLTGIVQPTLLILLVSPRIGLGLGVPGVIWATGLGIAAEMVLALWQLIAALRSHPPLPRATAPLVRLWRRFFTYTAVAYLEEVSVHVTSPDLIAFVLAWAGRTGDLAELEVSWNQVALLITYLLWPLRGVYVPVFAELAARGDLAGVRNVYARITRLLWLLLVPAQIGLLLVVPGLFALILPDRYTQAVPVAQVLVLFLFNESLLSIPHVLMMVFEAYPAVVLSRLFPLLAAGLLLWKGAGMAVVHVAWVLGAGRLLARFFLLLYAHRRLNLAYPWTFAGRILAASGLMALPVALLGRAVPVETPWLPFAQAGVGALTFFLAFRRLGGLDREDVEWIARRSFPLRGWVLKLIGV